MNEIILQKQVQDFVQHNLKSDVHKLALKGSPFKDINIQELIGQIEAKRKCEKKLPSWFHASNIYYPSKINIEQTSSEFTARHKSHLIKGESIIDLTGGFGVDDIAFSKQFKKVTHCELNVGLSKIVSHNLKELGIHNIDLVEGDGIDYVLKNDNCYDWIYIDPSRRNDKKGKVFMLKDCLPNVPQHLLDLLDKSNHILLKISPLMDITSCVQELEFVKEIHIIAVDNEVKEILVFIEKGYNGEITVKATHLSKKIEPFTFSYQQDYNYTLSPPLKYLYEPNSAILKSGGFSAVAHQYKLDKLHQHSHLYTSNQYKEFPGRAFEILHILPYNKKKITKLLPNKKANITTRNFKETVAMIRKKTGIKEGGDVYLFFTTDLNNHQIVLFCKKL
ncbi:MAG: class I SAM-dependent methyltransferase [Wenyingzhuangia sp.]|uniref:THUMP-like domain-containing protein n=1 Tax=Wenyingzhuangia sp. TaxID=1964193 RepID=UPI00321C0DA6